MNIINSVQRGRRHLCYSLRVLFNFLEEAGLADADFLNKLRKSVKLEKPSVDYYVPTNNEVIEAYKRIRNEETKMIFKLLAYSGIRVVEAARLLTDFNPQKLIVYRNIAKYPLSFLRRTKSAYYAYMPCDFASEIKKIDITASKIVDRFRKIGLSAKYLRKWNYNFLISNGVPESVVDFLQGRATLKIGAMHYLAKVKQADEWYSRVVPKLLIIFNE